MTGVFFPALNVEINSMGHLYPQKETPAFFEIISVPAALVDKIEILAKLKLEIANSEALLHAEAAEILFSEKKLSIEAPEKKQKADL